LLEQVYKSALILNAVKTCVSCHLFGMSEVFHCLLDVLKTHFAGRLIHNPAALNVNQLLGIDRRGTKRHSTVGI
jgi:hypothetical protein